MKDKIILARGVCDKCCPPDMKGKTVYGELIKRENKIQNRFLIKTLNPKGLNYLEDDSVAENINIEDKNDIEFYTNDIIKDSLGKLNKIVYQEKLERWGLNDLMTGEYFDFGLDGFEIVENFYELKKSTLNILKDIDGRIYCKTLF